MKYYTNDPQVIRVAQAAFPSYNGKKFCVSITPGPISIKSYWEGGSRDFYNFVRLENLKVFGEIPQQSMFDKPISGADKVMLMPGLVCVRHSIFRGKDMGCTLIIHPENAKLFPPPEDDSITEDEKIVINATCRYKSSYAGRSDNRFYEAHQWTKITRDRWDVAKTSLIQKGYLNKRGSVTIKGRNLRETHHMNF